MHLVDEPGDRRPPPVGASPHLGNRAVVSGEPGDEPQVVRTEDQALKVLCDELAQSFGGVPGLGTH